ncbi:MAG: hypothetical protein ACXV3F_00285 [Frankiaceae bacterium]
MPRLRVVTACPEHPEWVPGQVVDASAEQAQQLLAEGRAELVREQSIERAEESWRRT